MAASIWNPGAMAQAATGNGTVTQDFTLTTGQTLVTLTTYTYTVGAAALKVFLNGVLQVIGADYLETSSVSITLTNPATAGDTLELLGIVNLININPGMYDSTEVDIAAATTTDIGGAGTQFLRVVGATTITSLGNNFRGPLFLRFTGACTIKAGVALITPAGVNLVVGAGYTCIATPKATSGIEDGWVVSDLNAQLYYPAGTGAVATTVQEKLHESVSVKDFGADPTGVVDSFAAITAAITYVHSKGGGTVFFPHGTYLISAPIEVKTGIDLIGEDQYTQITKTSATLSSGGINSVIYGNAKNRFRIENLLLYGDRVRNTSTGVVTVAVTGLYLDSCSYFDVINIRSEQCYNGFVYNTCYCCSLQQATAQQCQFYAYVLQNANTSTVVRNTTAWGCGGGWYLSGCIYTSLIGCACDHSDAGKKGDDPFLPSGSGGDYQNPKYIFELIGCQGITIVSPGTENSYSQYMYCEGAQVTVISPFIYNLQCYATTWRFISTRGTATSNVSILNPWGFDSVTNTLAVAATRTGFYVETASKQRINIVGRFRLDSTWGAFAYSTSGVFSDNETKIVDYSQQSMVIGANASFIKAATDVATVALSGSTKQLTVDAVSANVVNFDQPLPSEGLFRMEATGFYSSGFDIAKIYLIETNGGTTNILKTWTNSGNALSISEWVYVSATPGYSVNFRITTNNVADTMYFTNLKITHIPNQV